MESEWCGFWENVVVYFDTFEPLRVEDHIVQRYVQSYGAGGTVIESKA